jgi:hypothetical protein
MSGGCFTQLSARDTEAYAGWLHDRLGQQVGNEIAAGHSLPARRECVGWHRVTCPSLSSASSGRATVSTGGRAFSKTAFESGIKVIPVLTSGVSMPHPTSLTPSLRPLVSRHAIGLSYENFENDLRRLIAAIDDNPASDDGRRMGPTRESIFVEVERLYRAKIDLDVPPCKYDPLIKAAARRSELDRLVNGLEEGERPAQPDRGHTSPHRSCAAQGRVAALPAVLTDRAGRSRHQEDGPHVHARSSAGRGRTSLRPTSGSA